MRKPEFLERSGSKSGSRAAVIAAGAGGLVVGAVIGAGAVLGFRKAMRGFTGLPKGVRPRHAEDNWIPPHEAAFPKDSKSSSLASQGEAPHTTWPGAGASESTGVPEQPTVQPESDARP